MRRVVIAWVMALVVVGSSTVGARRAEADTSVTDLWWIPLAAGYLAETIVFSSADNGSGAHGLAYGTTEAALNAPLTGAFATFTIMGLQDGNAFLTTIMLVPTFANGYLAYDGIQTMTNNWPHPVSNWAIAAGLVDVAQVMAFTTYDALTDIRSHDTWGTIQVAVNAPIALGLGYLAFDEQHDGHGGPAVVLGLGAAVSAGLTGYGAYLAARSDSAAAPLHGVMFVPTLVGDGRNAAFGFAASGRL